jgi:branched-chain amino acid transport system ATP-binding protein
MTAPAPALKGISVRIGGLHALSSVDMSVELGEVRGLIGPNGAGKTTLLDVISGFRLPEEGDVELAGDRVNRRSAMWRARHGMRRTFQRQQVFHGLTVTENLAAAHAWHHGMGSVGAHVLGVRRGRAQSTEWSKRVDVVIELCQLGDVRNEFAGRLPIGTARFLELARAIVDEPTVLLLDEISSGLTHEEVGGVSRVISELAKTGRTAIVVVEHNVPFVVENCSRLTVLSVGHVIADDDPQTVLANTEVRAAYLGTQGEAANG